MTHVQSEIFIAKLFIAVYLSVTKQSTSHSSSYSSMEIMLLNCDQIRYRKCSLYNCWSCQSLQVKSESISDLGSALSPKPLL